jgi:hypothetical protein
VNTLEFYGSVLKVRGDSAERFEAQYKAVQVEKGRVLHEVKKQRMKTTVPCDLNCHTSFRSRLIEFVTLVENDLSELPQRL